MPPGLPTAQRSVVVAAWLSLQVADLDVYKWALTSTSAVTLGLTVAVAAAGGSTTGLRRVAIVARVKTR